MNWLVIAVVGAAAAWFEYNYQRSRHVKSAVEPQAPNAAASAEPFPSISGNGAANPAGTTVPETAHVAEAGNAPSISPGDENDKKLNSPDAGFSKMKAYSTHAQQ